MTVSKILSVETERIEDADGLDPIHVFWMDVAFSAGYCTIICYGSAWTVFFGGMNGDTIREFFRRADTEYLAGKMGNTPHLKGTKRDNAYLGRIIDAVKESIR